MKRIQPHHKEAVTIAAPPAKAYTLRALFISSLAAGRSIIERPLLGEDQQHAIECLRRLGIAIQGDAQSLTVEGQSGQFEPTASEMNVGKSGVTMNFLTALACLSLRPVMISGAPRTDERLPHRRASCALAEG
jgi:3-phosphoshikimate 1-carboxyvinyltransferase